MNIKQNLEQIKSEIGNAKLIAVTKSVDIYAVKQLIDLGHDAFGENKIQNAKTKIQQFPDANWHMIGHLQSNKVKPAVELFDSIDSVDSIKLAKKINQECANQNKNIALLIQINIANEPQKYGFRESELENALNEISKLKNIKLDGLMMIAPNIESEQTRQYFRQMKQLFDKYKQRYNLKTLSMGMSSDYNTAVEEGSNMVRVGTKLFI